jgi:hypothetical protein
MKRATKQVQEGLPGIKIYPCIGNHDTYPQDVISMRAPKSNYVINNWAPLWDSMVGEDPKQLKLWRDWGYFGIPFVDSQGK